LGRAANFLGGGNLGDGWSIMRVLTNLKIKIFYANLFKQVFVDLNQLTDPHNDVQTSFGDKAAPVQYHAATLNDYRSIPVVGLNTHKPARGRK
jgi:hypothetical protein